MANLLNYSKKLIFCNFMLLIYISSFSQPNSNYRLVYSDEFNSLPDTPKWNVEQFGPAGGLSAECWNTGHGYYNDPKNLSVQNGILTIKGGQYSITQNTTYNAGGIGTGYVPQFGYFEISCKMPSKIGFYPAFVFYNYSSSSWQEIDVFEYNAEKTFYQASLHYETDYDNIHGNNHDAFSKSISVPIISNSYQRYGVDWQPSFVDFYFDGVVKYTCSTLNNQEPMIMGIGLGIDVCYGNSPPNSNDVSFSGNEESQQFKIDYFRHYQKQNDALRFLHTNNNFCINTTENRVAVSNYPNAQYSWVIPSQVQRLETTVWDANYSGAQSIRISSNQPGTYPISVTATFPSGYTETKTINVTFLAPTTNSIGGTFNNSSSLSYVNFTNNWYNSVQLSCTNAYYYEVTQTSGDYVYINCNGSACSFFNFELNSGQSFTVSIKAYDQCDNMIGSRNVTFVRQQGYYGRPKKENDKQNMEIKVLANEIDNSNIENSISLKSDIGIISKDNFMIFPNPSQSFVNVAYPKNQVDIISITNILGKNVKTLKVKSDNSIYQNIDISDFQNGVYIVSFYGNSKEILFRDKLYVSR